MTIQTNNNYIAAFKADVALAAIRGEVPLEALAARHGVHVNEIASWRRQLERHASLIFSRSLMPAPRSLPNNPFGTEYCGLSLDERVKIAIEESAKYGRSVGAVVIPIKTCEVGTTEPPHALVEDLASHLRECLRASDYVMPDNGGRILAYLSLLNSLDDLHTIGRRLAEKAALYFDNSGYPEYTAGNAGVSFHPTDGDTADALACVAEKSARPVR